MNGAQSIQSPQYQPLAKAIHSKHAELRLILARQASGVY